MSINKLTQNDKFRSWLNKINEIIDSVNQSITDLNGKAAKKHSSTETSYGLGTSIEYGHLKLSDSTNNSANVNNGIAATPYSVKLAYDLASEAKELAQNTSSGEENILETITDIKNSLDNKSPTRHNSTQDTYGLGSLTDYGHVKLSVSLTSESGTNDGIAVAPYAVKTLNDKITTLEESVKNKSPLYHADKNNTYGAGTSSLFGHLKISDDVTLDSSAQEGIAASIGALKTTYDIANSASENVNLALEKISMCAPTNHASPEAIYGMADSENYGHVKITDALDSNADSTMGTVPSAKALSTTHSLIDSANTKIQEIQDTLDDIKNNGGLNGVENINDVDLNTIITNGKYVSNYSTLELNYPYIVSSKLSILEVTAKEFDTLTISQTLYSENSIYTRYSYNGGVSWDTWKPVSSGSNGNDLQSASIYFSSQYGNDENSGSDPFLPVQTWERVFEIMNSYYEKAYLNNNMTNIAIYLDRGTYTDIPVFYNLPLRVLLTSFYYETIEESEDDVNPGELEENKPYIPKLDIYNSNVTVSNLKIDNLIAHDVAIVNISLNEYISLSHIESDSFSIVYLGSIYRNEDSLPLHIHNNPESTSMLCSKKKGTIYDINNGTVLSFKENVTFTYLFECLTYSNIYVPKIQFNKESEDIQINATQYYVSSGSNLYYPELLYGNDVDNVKNVNSIVNGYLIGECTGKAYLRDDGTWTKILDTESVIVNKEMTITEENIKNIILINGNYTITVPKISVNAIFTIKNVSNTENATIHPEGITIDGSSEDIILRPYEFIQIVQYSDTEYALIIDNRVKSYNLMNLNLENTIITKDTITSE